jgi:amino acid transporter
VTRRHESGGNPAGRLSAALAKPELEIESVPFLGTSWYRRGPSYWFRRALFTLFWLALVAAEVAITAFLLLPTLNRNVAVVFLLLVIVVGFTSGVWLWRRSPSTQPEQPSPRRKTWTRVGTVAAVVALAVAGGVTGGGIFFWLLPFGLGFCAVVFLKSLAPVTFLEREAREMLGP